MQYVGQTENIPKRLNIQTENIPNNHKSSIGKFEQQQNTRGYSGTEVYNHINLPGHNVTNVRITILEYVAESSALSAAERKCI